MDLEGKELEGPIGDVGSYSVDVDMKGAVKVSAVVEKDFGYGKVSSVNSIETNVFKIAEEIAKKTSTHWDDDGIAALKKILGIVD